MFGKLSSLSTSAAILIGASIIALSIFISGYFLSTKIASLGVLPDTPTTTSTKPIIATVSVDDDPVLGDPKAPVTLIEFSDYECPYCKRHFTEVHPQLIKNYVDTGKVKIVFRDFPLSFHNPMATFEAIAASCSRDQGGDTTYFKFHDELFKRTKSNGKGLTKDDVYKIGEDLKLDTTKFRECLDTEKYKDEVAKDSQNGTSVGVAATPSFYVGKSSTTGSITGTQIRGAQPYSAFTALIDPLLK